MSAPAMPRPRWALVAGLILLVAAWVLTVTVLANPRAPAVQDIDDGWRELLMPGRDATATTLARAVTSAGNGLWAYLLVGIVVTALLTRRRLWAAAYIAGAVVVTSVVVIPATKVLVGRDRPPDPLVHVTSAAFPSGHAAFAAVAATALALALTARGWWWLAVTAIVVAMMWSRMYLSVHWLTDTVAGALVGSSVALLLYWVAFPRLSEGRR